MADRGHELTDELLEELEKRIAEEYAQASRDMQKKLTAYLEKFNAEDAVQKKLLEAGKITEKEYADWRFRHTMMGKRWEEMRDVLAEDMEHANEIALGISRAAMPDVYALNANFATYQIEHDARINTGFTLYDHNTAELLLSEQRQLMPGPSTRKAAQIAADKAMQWNRQKIQSAVLQGVLQGESPYKVAERLRNVAAMNYNASVRYARTMTTSAQNSGRYQGYRRAKKIGVDLTIEWQATLDGRTRHEHRMMHGQRREVDEPFEVDGVKILYPAQSDGPGSSDIPQGMIWNCRCTLLAWVKGFEGDTVKSSTKMGGMSFEEWQAQKQPLRNTGRSDNIAHEVSDVDTTARMVYDKLTGQTYNATESDNVALMETARDRLPDGSYGELVTRNTGTYHVPDNNTEDVVAYILPKGTKTFSASDTTQNTILTNGRVALNYHSGNNNARQNVADIVENEMYLLTGDRRSGVFYRIMNTEHGVEHLKSGKIRPSVNHMTGESEGGLSVWEIPKYGGGRLAKVTGDVIGIGSDGEPVLDVKTVRFVRVVDDQVEMRENAIRAFAQKYNWTEEQVRQALNRKIRILR